MGIYIDKGNEGFRRIRNSEYVDKSGIIAVVNRTLFTEKSFTCVTRCRRFGKSMAAKMLAAYYDRSCDSRPLFADLQIAGDATFEEHLNKYPVIYLDLSAYARTLGKSNIVELMEMDLIADISTAYPDVPAPSGGTLMNYLMRIHAAKGDAFIFIIDEWDSLLRENSERTAIVDSYVNWLRSMFKAVAGVEVFAGVYMTGILPVKKYKTESALNNFLEYSMVKPGRLASFFGFTKEEVQQLAERHGMDFDELEKWYDGYHIGDQTAMFNPNSVMQAIYNGMCTNYWSGTGTFTAVVDYIKMDFEGLKDDIINMIAGERSDVDPTGFLNDISEMHSRDDVLTVLIHTGYLSFDWREKQCYVPNMEVSDELKNAVKDTGWAEVARALDQSSRLLRATVDGNAAVVGQMVDAAHTENTSILSYNDENSMACVLAIAYYSAHGNYIFHREYATGRGYADLVLIPRKNVRKPAIVIELKYGHSADEAIAQMRERRYWEKVSDYSGDILLVGISYDRETKTHQCKIERSTI